MWRLSYRIFSAVSAIWFWVTRRFTSAGFLALVAITPTVISGWMGVSYSVSSFYGGTGLLIAVSVAFDLVQKIDSHVVMRNYKGLLE